MPSILAPVSDNPVGSAPFVILNVIVPASGSVACNVIVEIVAPEANVPKLPAAVVHAGMPLKDIPLIKVAEPVSVFVTTIS